MLATAAPGRTSEQQPHSTKDSDPTPQQYPYRSPASPRSGRTPSISPLSTASKSHNDSAMTTTTILQTNPNGTRSQFEDEQNPGGIGGSRGKRDRSSSLSDIEASLSEREQEQTDSEDGSTGQDVEEDDSEAETERIKPTPKKMSLIPKTSPQDSRRSHVPGEISDGDSSQTEEDHQSSPRKTAVTLAGQKRKRNALGGDARRTTSDETDSDAIRAKKQDSRPHHLQTRTGDHAETLLDDDAPTSTPQSPVKERKRKGRSTGNEMVVKEDSGEKEEADLVESVDVAEEEKHEELDPEEVARREHAIGMISNISGRFGNLKSKLHADRIAEADAELAQLQQSHPTHPEFLRQLQTVTSRRDTKIEQEMKYLQYKRQTLRTSTLANRAQLLSQYMQEGREIRERILYELGKQWYDVQKGRRESQADEIDNGIEVRFPKKRSTQIRHQAKYNKEVSILSGVAKYIGFPAAPEIAGVKDKHLEDDLKAMKIVRRQVIPVEQRKQQAFVPRPAPTPSQPTSEHIAAKEFLEQTPWANPHHPVHAQSRTPSGFGNHPIGVQPSSAFTTLARPSSAFSTPQVGSEQPPNNDRRPPNSNETIGILSDPPSSVLAAPPTVDRIRLIPFENAAEGSPLAHMKRASGGRRDFSGLSGASTIDAPIDSAVMESTRPQSVPFEAPPTHQQHMMAVGSSNGRESQG